MNPIGTAIMEFNVKRAYMQLFSSLQELLVQEFSFHQLNANLLWPGTFAFAEWLVEHRTWLEGRRVLELGRYLVMVQARLSVL